MDPVPAQSSAVSAPSPARSKLRLVLGIAGAVLLIDLVTKLIVVARLEGEPDVELLGGLLKLNVIRNSGAAFGMGAGFTIVFTVVAALVAVVVVRTARRLRSLPWAIALGALLGGALGNLVDRVFRSPGVLEGHVVDFLEIPRWPIFNVADAAITCAGVAIVVLSLWNVPLEGPHEVAADSGPDADAAADVDVDVDAAADGRVESDRDADADPGASALGDDSEAPVADSADRGDDLSERDRRGAARTAAEHQTDE